MPGDDAASLSGAWLTRRERVVLAYLVERLTYAEIAKGLYVSPNTVKSHVASVYAKLGVHGREAAIARAAQLGLVDDERPDIVARQRVSTLHPVHQTLTQTITHQARQLVGSDYASLTVPTASRSALIHCAGDGDEMGKLTGALLPLNDSMSGIVFRERAPQSVTDVWADRRASRPPGCPQDTGPVLFVPVYAGAEVLGILTVANRRDREPFTGIDINTVMTLATYAAVALEDSRPQETINRLSILDQDRQRIVATMYELLAEDLTPDATNRVSETIDRLDTAIQEIHDAVFPPM